MATRGRMILSYMGRLSNKSTSSTNITRAIAFSHHYRSTLVDVPSIAAPLLYPTSTNIHPPQICYSYGCLNHARSMSCCAGVGSPPPREIVVEYSEEDYTNDFIKLANEIEEAFPEFLVSGNPDGVVKPREGAFEITLGDSVLFSKLKTNRMPELEEVFKAIDALPPAQCPL